MMESCAVSGLMVFAEEGLASASVHFRTEPAGFWERPSLATRVLPRIAPRVAYSAPIMGKKDPRIDAYIKKAAPFARPILSRIRSVVHTGCPRVEETIKWGMPAFRFNGPLCGMAAFKSHATLGFWKAPLLRKGRAPLGKAGEKAMGQFGRITSVEDLPPQRALVALVRKAAALNEQGVKVVRAPKPNAPLPTPRDLMAALRKNRAALRTFEAFSSSHKREYVEWILEAKREETRARRIEMAVQWMSKGRGRNWRYA